MVVGVLKSLESNNYLKLDNQENRKWVLTKDGLDYV